MVHEFPPEDPRSPASPFAQFQPGLGMTADDVPDEDVARAPEGHKAADFDLDEDGVPKEKSAKAKAKAAKDDA